MRMCPKATAARDGVVTHDPQAAKAHPARVLVLGKGKGVTRAQPAMVGVASFIGFSNRHHSYQSDMLAPCQAGGGRWLNAETLVAAFIATGGASPSSSFR